MKNTQTLPSSPAAPKLPGIDRSAATAPGVAMILEEGSAVLKDLNGDKHRRHLTILVDRWAPYISGYYFGDGRDRDQEKAISLLSALEGVDERYYHHEYDWYLYMPLPHTILGDFPGAVAASLNVTVVKGAPFNAAQKWAEIIIQRLISALEAHPYEAAQQVLGVQVARWNMEQMPSGFSPEGEAFESLADYVNWGLLRVAKFGCGYRRTFSQEIAVKLLPRVQHVDVGRDCIRVTARGVTLEYLPMGSMTSKTWPPGCISEGFYDPRSVNTVLIRRADSEGSIHCRLLPKNKHWADMTWAEASETWQRIHGRQKAHRDS